MRLHFVKYTRKVFDEASQGHMSANCHPLGSTAVQQCTAVVLQVRQACADKVNSWVQANCRIQVHQASAHHPDIHSPGQNGVYGHCSVSADGHTT